MRLSPDELLNRLSPFLRNGFAAITTSQVMDAWQCTGQTARRRMDRLRHSDIAVVSNCRVKNSCNKWRRGFYVTDLRHTAPTSGGGFDR
jgi:hypothetical protein